MRRGMLLILSAAAVLAALPAAPPPANAQNPGRIFGIITSPMRMMMRRLPRPRLGVRPSLRRGSVQRSVTRQERGPDLDRSRAARLAGAAGLGAGLLWPSAVANAYEDVFGYALWPGDFAESFWSRGTGDIVNAMMAPSAASASSARSAPAGICTKQAQERAQAPFLRVEQTLELTPVQRDAFEALRAAAREAVERETIACSHAAPATPAERLAAMADGLWALHYAASFVRAPLETFYATLTDAQKAKLADTTNEKTAACGQAPSGAGAAAAGNESVEKLAKFLAASCPQEPPSTPVERLDAAGERLAMMAYAVMSMDPTAIPAQSQAVGSPKAQAASSTSGSH